jgi:hypothetical protein
MADCREPKATGERQCVARTPAAPNVPDCCAAALRCIPPPRTNLHARLEQIREPARIQALIPQLPVETFHVPVLHWPPWLNMHQLDIPLDCPRQNMPRCKLRSVVTPNRFRRSSFCEDPIQLPRHSPLRAHGMPFVEPSIAVVSTAGIICRPFIINWSRG